MNGNDSPTQMTRSARTDVAVLAKRWKHHSLSGGFDRIADFLRCTTIRRQAPSLATRLARRTVEAWWKPPSLLMDYCYEDRLAERRIMLHAWRHRARIVHVLYGDEQLDLLVRYRHALGAKLVATFHLPFARTQHRFQAERDRLATRLDHFMAVSTDLAADLAAMFGNDRVSYVPHGIDTTAFCPGRSIRQPGPLTLLTVGYHMRDLEIVHRVADYAATNDLPVRFQYVGPKHALDSFLGCDNVRKHTDIDEVELIHLYRNADAVFLPVLSATANNSLLESLACGTPVISSRIGGIPDYLDDSCGWLLPHRDSQAAISLVKQLCADPDECDAKRTAARRKAMEFDWLRVADLYNQIYNRVAPGTNVALAPSVDSAATI